MKKFICGLLSSMLIMTAIPAFAETTQSISAIFGRVKLVVNGSNVSQETLLYNGTTYVPLRAVSEILDKEVQYDANTKTAYIDNAGTNRTIASQKNTLSEIQITEAQFVLIEKTVDLVKDIVQNENLATNYALEKNYTLANKHLKLALDGNSELQKINLTDISKEMNTTVHNFSTNINTYLNGYVKVVDSLSKGNFEDATKQAKSIQKNLDDSTMYLQQFYAYFD